MNRLSDEQASVVVAGLLDLAVSVRDDGPLEVQACAQRALDAAHGDPIAALTVAAALIRADLPVDAWWQRGLAGVGQVAKPCGTHAAYVRHQSHGEEPCEPCKVAQRAYQRDRARERRQRAKDAA